MTRKPKQLTLVARIEDILRGEAGLAEGYSVRATAEEDKQGLVDLYYASYTRDIVRDKLEALKELEQTFEGEYGRLDLRASPVALCENEIVGSVMTVEEAPWDDTPPGPFIIEVMVHHNHRRRGLAAYLIKAAAEALAAQGKQTAALRVMSGNEKALRLYRTLGFTAWDGRRRDKSM
jgi:ribosomal protein S18 acetylase RimI-like enzyme